jgi:type II secretory pathway pseudopilin PulG
VKNSKESGFTVPELAIAVTVAGFLAAAIFIATFYYYVNVSQAQTTTDMALESQSILTQLTDDIRLSDAISSTNALTDSNAPVGGWVTSNPSNIIIIESPAVDSAHNIIYNSNTGFPYRNEFIYFIKGGSMYKRILANVAATNNTAVTTCPANLVTPSCPADRLFSSNANNLSFTFYDLSGNTTADASKARSVFLQIDMVKKSFGKNISFSNKTRITLRNQ